MKQLLLIIFCVFYGVVVSAQMGSRNFIPNSPVTSAADGPPAFPADSAFDATALPTFGLYGIGNTNTESFNDINSSGKLTGYIRPYKGSIKGIAAFVDVNFAFNVNASNTDSLAVSTILFPDIGKNSFSGSVILNLVFGKKPNYYLISPFFEFANKNISGRKEDSSKSFYTINSSFGINFQYLCIVDKDMVSFTISPYFASANIPDPGKENYRYLLAGDKNSPLKTTINSAGAKITFQYNYFQIFADFRTVTGSKSELPVDGLKGFHSNIGITFNAEIFEK